MASSALDDKLIEAWFKRISEKMVAECSSSAEYIVGKDVKVSEVQWMTSTLASALSQQNIDCRLARFNPPGQKTYCNCNSSVCYHSDGLKLIFSLRAAKE